MLAGQRARCSNKLLEHLEHLHETNDLFGNVAKSDSDKGTGIRDAGPLTPGKRGFGKLLDAAPGMGTHR
jgi:hypothetical protein